MTLYPHWQMTATLFAVVMIVVPFGLAFFGRGRGWPTANAVAATIGYVVAFNLVFFVQELALVLSKAAVPGLHPVLFHNNHDWTGTSPVAELLQGAGALTILVLGLLALRARPANPTLRLLAALLAFHGIVQSLAQGFAGAILPGNDVGRAITYLGFGAIGRALAVAGATLAMASLLPRVARRLAAAGIGRGAILLGLAVGTILVLPFRVPGSIDQVAIVPVAVAVIGGGWLLARAPSPAQAAPHWRGLAVAAFAILAVFQLVLRHGIAV